jgi:hypothetical protein
MSKLVQGICPMEVHPEPPHSFKKTSHYLQDTPNHKPTFNSHTSQPIARMEAPLHEIIEPELRTVHVASVERTDSSLPKSIQSLSEFRHHPKMVRVLDRIKSSRVYDTLDDIVPAVQRFGEKVVDKIDDYIEVDEIKDKVKAEIREIRTKAKEVLPTPEWVPSKIPMSRRLQMTGLVLWFMLIPGTLVLLGICLFTPPLWPFFIAYLAWIFYDKAPDQGSRKRMLVRRWPIWRWMASYFPVKLHKTIDLPPGKNYLFGYHPYVAWVKLTLKTRNHFIWSHWRILDGRCRFFEIVSQH